MNNLGDVHNFGEFVYAENKKVFKPRTLFWEHLFLNSKSELRKMINQLCDENGLASPFNIAPDLEFELLNFSNGWVERLRLSQNTKQLTINESQSVAAVVGLCFWFGIGDLHFENVFIGRNENDTLICFPIDIEVIFEKLTHVNQTLLFPSNIISERKCGLSNILNNLSGLNEDSKFIFIKTFLEFISMLNENAESILSKIIELNKDGNNYLRIILRDTKTYIEILEGSLKCADLIPEELVQIARGEVPFFVRLLDSDQIYYFKNKNKDLEPVKSFLEFTSISSIMVSESQQVDCVKTNTAIYSAAFIAELFGLQVEYGLSTSIISGTHKTMKCSFKEVFEIYEVV